ncbi:hypothetical protein FGO68_gene1456 [Halteria grandinella]|uniref:Major facilitator superfamily (MFS) profile domain-containing protein n=1 Tax=Halteria grandinella TaxID=5974 RepID=A0A8J8NYG8_HALGN|nr:hypothetical protein FGO68_gene1456 [Halteria grandinella]
MLGPIIGQTLYTFVQYKWTFFIFAGVMAAAMIVLVIVIPKSINHAEDIMSKAEIDQYFERLKSTEARSSDYVANQGAAIRSELKTNMSHDVTYGMILKNRKVMMAIVSAMFAMMFMLFFDGILTMHLISDMDINENEAGYFFALICATYAFSSPFVGILAQFVPRKWLTFFSFCVASLALLMLGPSKLFGFPDSIYLSSVGLALLGCSCSVIFVPLLPEIIDAIREQEGIRDSGTINDKATGVFNSAYALGCIIAPILGGYISMMTNFRTTCDIMAMSSTGYAAIFFIVIILPSFCSRRKPPSSPDTETQIPTPRTTQPYFRDRSMIQPGNTPLLRETSFRSAVRNNSEYLAGRGTLGKSALRVNFTEVQRSTNYNNESSQRETMAIRENSQVSLQLQQRLTTTASAVMEVEEHTN